MKVARIYLRVSTEGQDLARQEDIERKTREAGYYIAGVYREKASGARPDRPELLRMIHDLQSGDVVVAEKIDRISRLPLPEAEQIIAAIKDRGAKLSIPGVVDLSDVVAGADDISKIVLKAVQDMLLRLALQTARDEYETRRIRQKQGIEIAKFHGKYKGRIPDHETHERIVGLRTSGISIKMTAKTCRCSESQVKRVWAIHQEKMKDSISKENGDA